MSTLTTAAVATAWFSPGKGARVRNGEPTQIILHWTGAQNPPIEVYENLKKKRLSVHYVICQYGSIYQFAEEEHVTYHSGPANETSIGIEIVSRGTVPALYASCMRFMGRTYEAIIHGRRRWIIDYSPAQARAVFDLCDWITERWRIPRVVADHNNLDVLPDWQQFKGVLGHCHVSKSKPDPGPRILEALKEHWDES